MLIINYLKRISEELNISIGIQSIDEINNISINSLAEERLTEKELMIFKTFKFEKRKSEWLAGRIAAKKAFQDYSNISGNTNIKNISILNDGNRAPFILELPNLELSISHSSQYAIAVVSNSKIGIDLERITEHNPSIIKYYFSDDESLKINDKSNKDNEFNEVITKYWTRKEAVAKYLKLGMKINFKLLDTTTEYLSVVNNSYGKIRLLSQKIDDYYFSIAI